VSGEVRVATSSLHTLVIAPDGRVLCQGRNQYGVCGADQTTAHVETLSPVPGLPRGRAVAVGGDGWTSMVPGEDGRVYVWGQNNFGFFGGTDRGPTYVRPQPTPVAALERVTVIAAFEYGGAALRDHGTVWMWGRIANVCWRLACSRSPGSRARSSSRRGASRASMRSCRSRAVRSTCWRLKSDGTVWVWGANRYAQPGLGDTDPRASPTTIPSLSGVTRIYAAGTMSAARQTDGSWMAWGTAPSTEPPTRDVGGVLNDMPPVLTPSPLPGLLRDATDVAAWAAAFRDGTVRTWGGNSVGSLGTGGSVDATVPRGVIVRSLSGIVRVWAGGNRALALKSDGTLYLWGPAGTAGDRVLRVPTVLTRF